MVVRYTTSADIPSVMAIFERAREFMRSIGNPNQWSASHPAQEAIERDIDSGFSYVVEGEGGEIVATFALIFGDDPTYSVVYGGSWLSDAPYATIHRIASSGSVMGAGARCFEWSMEQCRVQGCDLRFDTHDDNVVMKSIATKYGFTYCGIIHLANGAERNAYHLEFGK